MANDYYDQQDYSFDPNADQNYRPNRNTQSVDYSGWTAPTVPINGTPPPTVTASNPFNYEQARDSWMSGQYGGGAEGAAKWAAANGVQYNGGDTITLPNGGGSIDIIGNYAGGAGNGRPMTNNWTPAGGNGPNPGGAGSAMAALGGGVSGGSSGGGMSDNIRNQLVQMLMGRAQQSLAVDANDPTIKAQADPYNASVERSARNYVADMAEKLGPNANLTGEQRLAAEHAGQASGLFISQLIGNEINSRRQEIQAALSGLQGYLTDQDRMALQKELSYLNDATQRMGLANSYDLGLRSNDLGQRQLGLEDWIAQNNDYYRRAGI